MTKKLSGHALENYKMIKKMVDSGLSNKEIDDQLVKLYCTNGFKGGDDMLKQTYDAICKNFNIEFPTFESLLFYRGDISIEELRLDKIDDEQKQ